MPFAVLPFLVKAIALTTNSFFHFMTSNPSTIEASPPEPDEAPASGLKQLAMVALGAVMFAVLRPDLFKTVAIFVVVLGVLIFVHEWGHFQFARWAGLKVNRFALGFPPFIYTRRYKGINYSIGALPIGGMVDIAGLGSEEEMVAEVKGQGMAPVKDTHRPRGEKQFQDVSLGWRFLTLFAGPLMNLLLATALFIGVYSTVGKPLATAKALISSVTPNSPAAKAGVQVKDQIIAVGSKKADELGRVIDNVHDNKLAPTTLTVMRGTKRLILPITPELKDIEKNGKPVPSIGVGFDITSDDAVRSFEYKKMTPGEAVRVGFSDSVAGALQILDFVKRALTAQLMPEEIKNIGGPVKIAKTIRKTADFNWAVTLTTAAMLSINLGLLNLLPLPALDGGRILFLGYELIMRRPVDPRKEGLIHAAGMVMLLSFMLFITLRDVNFFKLFGH